MKKNDVVSVITLAGEFVGKYQEMIDGQVSLKDPRMLVQIIRLAHCFVFPHPM